MSKCTTCSAYNVCLTCEDDTVYLSNSKSSCVSCPSPCTKCTNSDANGIQCTEC